MVGRTTLQRTLLPAMLACASLTISTPAEGQTMSQQTIPRVEGGLPSLGSATAWLNSEPLTAAGLRGKVVLVEFWTYTCINWLRTMPYVRAWAEKYRDRGLVVIGVHSPEFEFEKNLDNVRREAKALRVGFPIAVDSEHGICAPSTTSTGRRSTSSMPRAGSGIISSAKGSTRRRNESFSNCLKRREAGSVDVT